MSFLFAFMGPRSPWKFIERVGKSSEIQHKFFVCMLFFFPREKTVFIKLSSEYIDQKD